MGEIEQGQYNQAGMQMQCSGLFEASPASSEPLIMLLWNESARQSVLAKEKCHLR